MSVEPRQREPTQCLRPRQELAPEGHEIERELHRFALGGGAERGLRLAEELGIEPELLANLAFMGGATAAT